MTMMHETKNTKLYYLPVVAGDTTEYHELELNGLKYKPNGRKFLKWEGPSVDCYRPDYDGDFDLPAPPPEDNRIVLYNSPEFVPYYYILKEDK